jgi:hypothetical protein
MKFIFKSNVTGEKKAIELDDYMIRIQMEDVAYEKLCNCNCEPIGETYVIECDCGDKYEEFELQLGVDE